MWSATAGFILSGKVNAASIEEENGNKIHWGVRQYLKYGVDLTQKDLYQIFRKLITNRWWLEHHRELFGWKKYSADCYNNGGVETIPMNIYDNLSAINYFKTGKPYKEEPGYSLIKKIK